MNLYLINPNTIEHLEDHPKMLNTFINTHASEIERYKKLEDYFLGEQEILKRKQKHDTDPNNRIVTNYCRLATLTKAGYMVGGGTTLSSDNSDYLNHLSDIDEENNSKDKNMDLAFEQSIKGLTYEVVYIAPEKKNKKGKVIKKARPRYAKLKPDETFIVHSNEIEPEPLYAVRHYMIDDTEYVEIYSEEDTRYYIRKDDKFIPQGEPVENHLDGLPVYAIANNSFRTGDFEPIMGLQDDYNARISDRSNLLAYANDPLMKIINMSETQKEDIDQIHKMGAVLLEEGGDVDWLIKQLDDTVIKNHLDEIKSNMFTIACFPDWSSNEFTNALSGVAISFKLLNLQQITAISENKLQVGLIRRYELITNWLNKMYSKNYDINSLKITFQRNIPQNTQEIVNFVMQLKDSGLVSDQTLRGLLPFIEDIMEEVDRLEKEKKEKANNDEMSGIIQKYSQKANENAEEKSVEEQEAV